MCSTFSCSRRTLRREAGLVLKNVATLCVLTVGCIVEIFLIFIYIHCMKLLVPDMY